MVFKHLLKSTKTHYFLGGIAAALLAPVVAKSPTVRKAVVKTMAKEMEIQKQAQVSYENMKEEAADLAYEARMQAESNMVETAVEEEAPVATEE